MRIKKIASILSSPREFILVLHIFSFMLILPFMIKIFKIHKLVSIITPGKTHYTDNSLTLERVIYLCRRIQFILTKIGIKYSCLKRSLLLFRFLRYYGQPVIINFGVKWEDGNLTGHSWLSLDNKTYMEPEGKVEKFKLFFSIPEEESGLFAEESDTDYENFQKTDFD
ncbi:MAG TPA: lasso peptide biosynthesis B2 protein [Candidatus Krumholzibacteriaceae bacterium]|nr:lasso peptide biosynthesis B2 protein [Candidatus Krumholzibacteriaceae bacterium]